MEKNPAYACFFRNLPRKIAEHSATDCRPDGRPLVPLLQVWLYGTFH